MKTLDKLELLLDRIRKGDKDEKLRKEAEKLLSSVDILAEIRPEELQYLKQDFLEAGMVNDKSYCNCQYHKDNITEKLKIELPPDHILVTLINSHEQLIILLNQLVVHNHSVQEENNYLKIKDELDKIFELINKIITSQLLHQKEDEFIYMEIQRKSKCELPEILKMENIDIYTYITEIKNFVSVTNGRNFDDNKKEINISIQLLDLLLKEHIFKENSLLYPLAIEIIKDKAWSRFSKH